MRAAEIFAILANDSAALLVTNQAFQRLDISSSNHIDVQSTLNSRREILDVHRKRSTCHVTVLPVEILSQIFEYGALREDPDVLHQSRSTGLVRNTFVKRASQVGRH